MTQEIHSCTVMALFHDRRHAEQAYRALRQRPYSDSDVKVMMSEDTRQRLVDDAASDSTHVHGGTVGAVAAALVAEMGSPSGESA